MQFVELGVENRDNANISFIEQDKAASPALNTFYLNETNQARGCLSSLEEEPTKRWSFATRGETNKKVEVRRGSVAQLAQPKAI